MTHLSCYRRIHRGLAASLMASSVCIAAPAMAGERSVGRERASERKEVEVGRNATGQPVIRKRTTRILRDRIEVDIEVPETRTQVDPIIRHVPKANPAREAQAPVPGVVTGAHSRTTTSVSVTRDDVNHAAIVTWSVKREIDDTTSVLATHTPD
jgi:hypothetical protein